MFERLEARARQAAVGRAAHRRRQIAGKLSAELPPGIEVRIEEAGVALAGRGLKRRAALDPALRASIGRRT